MLLFIKNVTFYFIDKLFTSTHLIQSFKIGSESVQYLWILIGQSMNCIEYYFPVLNRLFRSGFKELIPAILIDLDNFFLFNSSKSTLSQKAVYYWIKQGLIILVRVIKEIVFKKLASYNEGIHRGVYSYIVHDIC